MADFKAAARLDCDLESFPRAITRRIIPVRGFAAMVNIITDPALPPRQRRELALALRWAIDDAIDFDGWYLATPPVPPRKSEHQLAELAIHAELADIRRESPLPHVFSFIGRHSAGYSSDIVKLAKLPE